jgi:hypothetical protein
VVKAKFLGGPELDLASGEDAGRRFADWLISPTTRGSRPTR